MPTALPSAVEASVKPNLHMDGFRLDSLHTHARLKTAGAEYIGVRDRVVIFRCREIGDVLRLYPFAVTAENVSLA
jgi:hypothetical protein